ncbi:MAG: ComEC/Rec2 family competence protein [Pseudomonadota bacterium]
MDDPRETQGDGLKPRAMFGAFSEALQRQRGHLLCFAPVCLGLGIGLYFALRFEPSLAQHAGVLGLSGFAVLAAWRLRHTVGPALLAMALIGLGFCWAGLRSHWVAGPVLDFRYYGPVEGRLVAIDRSASDKIRLTLDQVRMDMRGPPPQRVRVSLHGQGDVPVPDPGTRLIVTANVSPPPSPAEPGGFDFERHAWFLHLGGVGYARSPALIWEEAPQGATLVVFRTRMAISDWVQAKMPGQVGAVAAALLVGDRSGMDQDVVRDLRQSNLAHLLAISGLHMGLLTGFVFGSVRAGLALIPRIALRYPTRKIAAVVALIAGAVYLALSGGAVATERAFVMVAVVLGGVLADRRALTLRAVAIAALVVLALRPEALLSPGFQMSFAATTALVATFGALNTMGTGGNRWWMRGVRGQAVSLVLSSAIAGAATAPLAAAHFNIISSYGLIANLASVPLMGALVMPAAVVAVILAPFGLAGVALWVMGQGITWILFVADTVAGWDGAVTRVPAPGPEVLPIMALGALWIVLWAGRARLLGLIPMVTALGLWAGVDRPDLLISPTGGLIGWKTAQGSRALSRPAGDGFVAQSWLENDGDSADQETAHARGGPTPGEVTLGGRTYIHIAGVAGRSATCTQDEVLIVTQAPEQAVPCRVLTPETLRETGAIAVYETDEAPREITAHGVAGARLWNNARVRRDHARLWTLGQ